MGDNDYVEAETTHNSINDASESKLIISAPVQENKPIS